MLAFLSPQFDYKLLVTVIVKSLLETHWIIASDFDISPFLSMSFLIGSFCPFPYSPGSLSFLLGFRILACFFFVASTDASYRHQQIVDDPGQWRASLTDQMIFRAE